MAPVLKLAFAAELLQDVLPVFDTYLEKEHQRKHSTHPFYRFAPLCRSYIGQIIRAKEIIRHGSEENAPKSLMQVLKFLGICVRSKVGAADSPCAFSKHGHALERSLRKLEQLRARIRGPTIKAAGIKTWQHAAFDQQTHILSEYIHWPRSLDLSNEGTTIRTFETYLRELEGKSEFQYSLDAPILPAQQSNKRFPSPKYRPFADALHDALAKSVRCTRSSMESPEASTHTHKLNLCLYCAKMYDYTGEDVDLELTIKNHHNEWKACRFTSSTKVSNRGDVIDKLCETLDGRLPNNDTLQFFTNGRDFWHDSSVHKESMDYAANSERFLHDHLDRGKWGLLLEAKRKLMVIIARAVTQLFGSKWMQDDWTRRNILLFPTKDQEIPNVVLPFLSVDIMGKNQSRASRNSTSSGHLSGVINRGNALLRQLGILFVEIENGATTMEVPEQLSPVLSENEQVASDFLKAHSIYERLERELYGPLRSVIALCLYSENCPAQLMNPNCHDPGLIRELLDTHIVKPLEMELGNVIYPRLFSTSTPDFLQCDASHFRTRTAEAVSSKLMATGIVHPAAHETSRSLDALQSNRSFFFDQRDYHKDETYHEDVDAWFNLYEERVLKGRRLKSDNTAPRLKIAVLDSQIDCARPNLRGMGQRLKKPERFYTSSDKSQHAERPGHGSHVVALLHRMAPFADIYVAEIAGGEDVFEDHVLRKAFDHAIKPAPEGWSADMLVMAFGWDSQEPFSKYPMFYEALDKNKPSGLFFAAASNGGANLPRTYPATSYSVFAIHATDYNGDAPTPNFNPTSIPPKSYSTIGHQIPGDSDQLRVSGTSFATPVAAGIAASVIEFFRQSDDRSEWFRQLRTYKGMEKVFNRMAVCRGDYNYLDWANFFHPNRTYDEVYHDILAALKQPN